MSSIYNMKYYGPKHLFIWDNIFSIADVKITFNFKTEHSI